MAPADIITIVFGCLTIAGGIFGWMFHRLDKIRTVLGVKQEVIDTQQKTIDTMEKNNLLLEASARATNSVLSALNVVVKSGGNVS